MWALGSTTGYVRIRAHGMGILWGDHSEFESPYVPRASLIVDHE